MSGATKEQRARSYAKHRDRINAEARAKRAEAAARRPALPRGISLIELWSVPEPNSGCWLWLGAFDRKGYGRIARREYAGKVEAQKATMLGCLNRVVTVLGDGVFDELAADTLLSDVRSLIERLK